MFSLEAGNEWFLHRGWVRCSKRIAERRGDGSLAHSTADRRVQKSFEYPIRGGSERRQSAPGAMFFPALSPPAKKKSIRDLKIKNQFGRSFHL